MPNIYVAPLILQHQKNSSEKPLFREKSKSIKPMPFPWFSNENVQAT